MNVAGTVNYGISQDTSFNQSFQTAVSKPTNFSANSSLYAGGTSGNVSFQTPPGTILASNIAPGGGLFANQYAGVLKPKAPSTSSKPLGAPLSVAAPNVPITPLKLTPLDSIFPKNVVANDFPVKGVSLGATSLVDPKTGITKSLDTPFKNRENSPNIVFADWTFFKKGNLSVTGSANALPHFFDSSSMGPSLRVDYAPKNGPTASARFEVDGNVSNLSASNGLTLVGNVNASFPFFKSKNYPDGRLTINPSFDYVGTGRVTKPTNQQSDTYTTTLGVNYQLNKNTTLNLSGNAVFTPTARPEGTVQVGVSGSF
jgi:hypothetical protein